MTNVKCRYCGETFDRDTEKYALLRRRYAHAECYLQAFQNKSEKEKVDIVDPLDIVECYYCKEVFKKSVIKNYVPIKVRGNVKYAHASCAIKESTRSKSDEEKLSMEICKIFNTQYVPPNIQRQIKDYVENYNFSYNGIHGTVNYYCFFKKGEISLKNPSIHFVPYVYKEAEQFWNEVYKVKRDMQNKNPSDFKKIPREVFIKEPKRETKKKAFSFLDEDNI